MSSEIFKIIFEEFKKNGIKLNDYEYRGDTFVADPLDIVNFPILRGEDKRPLLDFSEHDKSFEDKIAELKAKIAIKDMDYKTASELLGKYRRKNESLKQRIAELEQSRSEWIDRAVEWQKKCEKLESEKTEKPVVYVLAKEIDGQHYVTVEDFMSVVNNLQKQRAD